MPAHVSSRFLLALMLTLVGCTVSEVPSDDAGMAAPDDADGDTISDADEGRELERDTDGDGTPDYLDLDSDGDGILDRDEAGDLDPSTPPIDSDEDGTPNYLDLDSDDNGYTDQEEGAGDADGDGISDYADLDDDNDGVSDATELGGILHPPVDSDGDGFPDYRDPDSDNDLILDGDEHGPDTDGDGLPDWLDTDSDADGIPDRVEAGDDDLRSRPVDTDGDRTPDFRDPDSDDDGLSDHDEVAAGTDPTKADTDGDGVTDLVEDAAGTDPLDALDNPLARGDFVFVMPHEAPPMPPRDTLDFATNIAKADVYFLMDETASMGSSIDSLSAGIAGLITRVQAVIPDAWFGLGGFRDYVDYGGPAPYEHYLDLTNDTAAAIAAANSSYEPSGGGDLAESHSQAVYATATGSGLEGVPSRAMSTFGACPEETFGYPCFRDGAVPIIVLIADAPMHNGPGGYAPYSGVPGAQTYEQVVDATVAARVRVTGIRQGSNSETRSHLEAIARDTHAVDATGRALVEDYTSGAIADSVVMNIQTLAEQSRLDITAEFVDDPSDAVDTQAEFLDHLEANAEGRTDRHCAARIVEDRDGDGVPETFPAVRTDTRVCFDIYVRQNDSVPSEREPQMFRATVRVIGDGFTELDSRDVYFLVPPQPPDIIGPD